MSQQLQKLKEKYRRIARQLAAAYGYPTWRQHLSPVDELVSTILSQSTTDSNRDRGFYALKERFASWEAVRDAGPQAVIDAIRPAGLANQKGPRIQAALLHLSETQGTITLDHLDAMPIEEAKKWLVAIKGVGPKTAAIILLFAMNRPAFPVDTHIHRVTKRLGLVGQKISAEKAHTLLEELVPEKDYYAFHLQVIEHGRKICRARNPHCAICTLQIECDWYQNLSPADRPGE